MRTCEFCGSAVPAMSTKCSGCGAAISLPTAAEITASVKATRATPEEAVRQAVDDNKPKGNWGCLIALVIFFWPAAGRHSLKYLWVSTAANHTNFATFVLCFAGWLCILFLRVLSSFFGFPDSI